jgi:DNA-binding transcriptional LysR family regulator
MTSRRIFWLGAPDFAINLFTSLLVALRADAPGVAIEWTGPRETMLLDVAQGLTDIAIAPADLSLPDGVFGEAIGGLKWRCFARKGHPAFSDWGADAWSRWLHLVVRVGDQLESPVNIAAAAAGVERTSSSAKRFFSMSGTG